MTATAATMYRISTPRKTGLGTLVKVVLVLAVAYGTHAVVKHAIDAIQVRECVENGGIVVRAHRESDGRDLLVCQLPDGRFGVQVRECDEEITSFVKNQMKRLEQVIQYLMNSGCKIIP